MNVTLLVLAVVAAFRLTVLVTTDRITIALRRLIAGWPVADLTDITRGEDVDLSDVGKARRPRLAYLVKCDWCSSVWLAPWPVAAAVLWPSNRLVWGVLLALTASAVTGVLSAVVSLVTALEGRVDAERKVMGG